MQEPVENANSEAGEHNESQLKTNEKLGIDYFNNQESDLKKTGAMSKYLTFPVFFINTAFHPYVEAWFIQQYLYDVCTFLMVGL